MDNILGLLNMLFLVDLEDPTIVEVLGLKVDTPADERLMGLSNRIQDQYRNMTPDTLTSISTNGKLTSENPWIIASSIYKILSRMESKTWDNPNCLVVANIVLVGTPGNPVPLSAIHIASNIIKAHNQIGHVTKVRLVVSNLHEMAIL